jgi:predicted nucleic acid-binding protein
LAILVSDTSIVIDLERGALIEALFQLQHDIVVPDVLFDRELKGPLGDRLITLGLRVEELTPAEVSRAVTARRQRAALSVPDAFAFALARERIWTLLTGDGDLRSLALAENVDTHGVLWIFDEFHTSGVVERPRLHAALTTISSHPRCRLPGAEVATRLAQYMP